MLNFGILGGDLGGGLAAKVIGEVESDEDGGFGESIAFLTFEKLLGNVLNSHHRDFIFYVNGSDFGITSVQLSPNTVTPNALCWITADDADPDAFVVGDVIKLEYKADVAPRLRFDDGTPVGDFRIDVENKLHADTNVYVVDDDGKFILDDDGKYIIDGDI